jgi:hypothetical protein
MIGGERQHHRLRIAGCRKRCARSNRGTGIPAARLQQNVGVTLDLGELLAHHEALERVGDDDRPVEQRAVTDPRQRILKRRAATEQ